MTALLTAPLETLGFSIRLVRIYFTTTTTLIVKSTIFAFVCLAPTQAIIIIGRFIDGGEWRMPWRAGNACRPRCKQTCRPVRLETYPGRSGGQYRALAQLNSNFCRRGFFRLLFGIENVDRPCVAYRRLKPLLL